MYKFRKKFDSQQNKISNLLSIAIQKVKLNLQQNKIFKALETFWAHN